MNYLAKLSTPIPHLNSRPVAGRWVEIGARTARSLGRDPRVEALIPNHSFQLEQLPDDLDARQWSLPRIKAPQAWECGTRGSLVAVLDTGLDTRHPDLRDNLWTNPGEIAGNGKDDDGNGVVDDLHGYNARTGDGDVRDGGEHGTHVAGIIAARGNNGLGVAGLNWRGQLMAVKVFDDHGNTDVATVCRGIDYAARQGARLLNCSWGGAVEFNQALFETLRDFPGLVVCSAGNSGSDNDAVAHYPSSFELENLVAVAATSRADGLCFTSCYGERSVDLGAPGEQILSTVPNGGYKVKSGTSQAAPHVTGVAALLSAQNPTASPEQLKERLLSSAAQLASLQGKVANGGRLDAAAALNRSLHGPHLLGYFYRDVQEGRREALEADNRFPDTDPRPQRVDLGQQQTLITPHGMALRELGPDGEPALLVWLEARREGETMIVDQVGYQRDGLGHYAFPLHLEGGADKPFDPAEAQRITAEEFRAASSLFEEQWSQGSSLRAYKRSPEHEAPGPLQDTHLREI